MTKEMKRWLNSLVLIMGFWPLTLHHPYKVAATESVLGWHIVHENSNFESQIKVFTFILLNEVPAKFTLLVSANLKHQNSYFHPSNLLDPTAVTIHPHGWWTTQNYRYCWIICNCLAAEIPSLEIWSTYTVYILYIAHILYIYMCNQQLKIYSCLLWKLRLLR